MISMLWVPFLEITSSTGPGSTLALCQADPELSILIDFFMKKKYLIY